MRQHTVMLNFFSEEDIEPTCFNPLMANIQSDFVTVDKPFSWKFHTFCDGMELITKIANKQGTSNGI